MANTMKEIIQNYLEEAIMTDPALAEVYDASKMDACLKLINERARKQPRSGNCVCIEDAVVFKWARDYFYGDMTDDETKVTVQPVIVKEGKKDTSHNPEDDVPFDSEIEHPVYDSEETNVHSFEEGKKKLDKKKYEDPRQLLMFDL